MKTFACVFAGLALLSMFLALPVPVMAGDATVQNRLSMLPPVLTGNDGATFQWRESADPNISHYWSIDKNAVVAMHDWTTGETYKKMPSGAPTCANGSCQKPAEFQATNELDVTLTKAPSAGRPCPPKSACKVKKFQPVRNMVGRARCLLRCR